MLSVERVTWPQITPQPMNTVLTVAGSDSSGGAGIEADIKAITANGAYALTAIAALTAQNTKSVLKVQPTDKETLGAIFEANFKDIRVDVVKTGLLTPDAIDLLSEFVDKYHVGKPIVIDPVLVATSGSALGKSEIISLLAEKLIKKATLLTPNLIEAQEILKLNDATIEIQSVDDLTLIAKKISELTGARNVLLKGGHIPWANETTKLIDESKRTNDAFVTDILYSAIRNTTKIFKSDFIYTQNTHGTGCTLASAISANIAKGYSIDEAVLRGIRYVHGAIISSSNVTLLEVSKNGPLNHFFNIPSLTLHTSGFAEGHFVDYLISHPAVSPSWEQYTKHPFVSKVADGSLSNHKWIRYISQDYPYLISYARINSVALSLAPDLKSINRQVEILNEVKHELDQHAMRLTNQGVTDFESLKFSAAGQAYHDYLFKVASGGDWLETIVALSPCLIGYYYASKNVEKITGGNAAYKDWIEVYRSEWYKKAVRLGRQNLEKYAVGISYEKTMKLVKIFADITLLEVEFWNDALHYELED